MWLCFCFSTFPCKLLQTKVCEKCKAYLVVGTANLLVNQLISIYIECCKCWWCSTCATYWSWFETAFCSFFVLYLQIVCMGTICLKKKGKCIIYLNKLFLLGGSVIFAQCVSMWYCMIKQPWYEYLKCIDYISFDWFCSFGNVFAGIWPQL